MWRDPIVEEIHSVRQKIAEDCNYDFKQIVERLRQREKTHKDRLVSLPPHSIEENAPIRNAAH